MSLGESPFVNDDFVHAEYDELRQNLNDGGPLSNQKEYDKRLEEYQKRDNMMLVNKEAYMSLLDGFGYTDLDLLKAQVML